MASSTLGPPGWQTHQPMSARVEAVVGEEVVDVVAEVLLDEVGTSASSTIRSPVAADVPAHGALGVGVEPAAGGEHLGGPASRRAARRRPTITTAAAPSPNSPLATRLAIETSSRCTVSEHSSTETQHGDVVGVAEQVVVQPGDPGGAGDAAEPEQRAPA